MVPNHSSSTVKDIDSEGKNTYLNVTFADKAYDRCHSGSNGVSYTTLWGKTDHLYPDLRNCDFHVTRSALHIKDGGYMQGNVAEHIVPVIAYFCAHDRVPPRRTDPKKIQLCPRARDAVGNFIWLMSYLKSLRLSPKV